MICAECKTLTTGRPPGGTVIRMTDQNEKFPKVISLRRALSTSPSTWGTEPNYITMLCPVCQFDCTHTHGVKTVKGNDNYEAGWAGRGDLVVVTMGGECGHGWELCIGFHKGQQAIFTRIHSMTDPYAARDPDEDGEGAPG